MSNDNAQPEFDPGELRAVFGRFPTGVTAVCGMDGDTPVGMAIGSFFSVSLEPPLVGWCVGKQSGTWAALEKSGSWCVNVLGNDQSGISNTFAGKSEDKFAGLEWEPAGSGSPKLAGCPAWIDCSTDAVHDGGDHWIVVGRILDCGVTEADKPLVFLAGKYGDFDIHE